MNLKKALTTIPAASALAIAGLFAVSAPASASDWDRLAECESNGNWNIDTGNGYYGGLQFSQQSWEAVGGSGSPANASKSEQIQRAEKLQSIQGWGAWPSCSAQLGLSGSPSGSPAPETQTQPVEQTQEVVTEGSVSENESTSTDYSQPVEEVVETPAETHTAPVEEIPVQESAPSNVSGETYTVVAGDTLGKIAERFGIDNYQTLVDLNDDIVDPNLIFVGQEIVIG